jgi:hypothetical protein
MNISCKVPYVKASVLVGVFPSKKNLTVRASCRAQARSLSIANTSCLKSQRLKECTPGLLLRTGRYAARSAWLVLVGSHCTVALYMMTYDEYHMRSSCSNLRPYMEDALRLVLVWWIRPLSYILVWF